MSTVEYRQTDGRLQRSERTRALIVASHSDLLREGVLRPTAVQIAERAGVSVRTLWSNFKDMEHLVSRTVEYWFRSDDDLRVEIDPGASLADRIVLFCAERERRLVNIAPAARAAVLAEPWSPALRESRSGHIGRVRADLERVFATELAAAADREELLDALTVAVSWNAWSLLWDDHRYPADRCRLVMERTLRLLLA